MTGKDLESNKKAEIKAVIGIVKTKPKQYFVYGKGLGSLFAKKNSVLPNRLVFFFDTGVTATGKGMKGRAGEHYFLDQHTECCEQQWGRRPVGKN